ncbi:MAG TPA: acyltransferase family protein [Desulfobacteria bacterium]|nr:acyltransferase family protein [Desulfobacteria bacterium]
MTSDKNLFKALFLVQLFGSFLVFVGHYTASASTHITPTLLETSLRHLSGYGTALLATITGFFTALSFEGKKVSGPQFFKGKFFIIYLPFLISGVVFHWALNGGLPSNMSDIANIFLGKTGAHLYFIFMLCQYYIFAYIFKNVITKKTSFYFLGLFFVIQFFFTKLTLNWYNMGVRHFLLTWIFTIYLGHLLYWYREKVLSWLLGNKLAAYILLAVSVTSMGYFTFSDKLYTANHLIFVFSSFTILLTGITFLLPNLGYFKKLQFRKGLTFYIYLTHPFFILYANNYMIRKLGFLWILENKAFFVVYLFAIYVVTFLFSYTWTGFIQMRADRRKQARQKAVSTAA